MCSANLLINKTKMELHTAIEILEYHHEWILGKREDIIHESKKLTEALGVVLSEVKKFHLDAISGSICKCEKPNYSYIVPVCNKCNKVVDFSTK